MRGKTRIFIVVLGAAALLFFTGVALFGHGWDLEEAVEVRGITGNITFSRPGGFTLTTSDGQKYKLAMHPIRFLEETGLKLTSDDRVSLSGYQVEDTVILVTEIAKGSTVFTLLDKDQLEEFGRRRKEMENRYGPKSGGWSGERLDGSMSQRRMHGSTDGPWMWDEQRRGCR
jgi:hypothetical protein